MLSDLYISEIRLNQKIHECRNYLTTIPVVRNMTSIKFKKRVSFFVGENGTGKSTLMEAIAVSSGFNAEGGSRNFNFSTFQSHSNLHEYITVSKGVKRPKDGYFLRAESFYNVASHIEKLDAESGGPQIKDSYGGKSLHEQSHGESFMSLAVNRFGGNGLYILDEPEAALSPSRLLAMLSLIHDLVEKNSQFIIATHSPILMAYPDADIFMLDDDRIKLVPYEETEHYILT